MSCSRAAAARFRMRGADSRVPYVKGCAMTSPTGPSTTGPSTTAPPPDPRRWWALGALVTALLVIGARAVMGTGAALIMPLAMSVLPSLFGPGERSTAVGAVSAASALGLPLGPLVGGWLLDHFWWGSVFLINVPLVLIGIAACVFLLPETSDPAAPPVDVRPALLTVTGLGALILGI